MNSIRIASEISKLNQAWTPHVLAQFDGHDIMVALGEKTYPWHTHVDFDDVFLVIQGQLTIEMRTEAVGIERVPLGSGDLFVVPRGVEHRPVTDGSAYFLLIEPTVQGRID